MGRTLKEPITVDEWLAAAKLFCPWCEDNHPVILSVAGWSHAVGSTGYVRTCRAHLMHEQIAAIRADEKYLEAWAIRAAELEDARHRTT